MCSPARKRTRGNQEILAQVGYHGGGPSTRKTGELAIAGPGAEETHEGNYGAEETDFSPGEFDDRVEPEVPLFLVEEMEEIEFLPELEGMGKIGYTSRRVSASEESMQLAEEESPEEEFTEGELAEEEILDQSKYKGKGTYHRLESFKMHQVYESDSDGNYADGFEEGPVYDVEETGIAGGNYADNFEEGPVYNVEEIGIADGNYADNFEEGPVYDVERIGITDEESSDLEEVIQVRAESPTYRREHQHSMKGVNFSDVNGMDEIVSTFSFLPDRELIIVKDNNPRIETQVNAEGSRSRRGTTSQSKKAGGHERGPAQVKWNTLCVHIWNVTHTFPGGA